MDSSWTVILFVSFFCKFLYPAQKGNPLLFPLNCKSVWLSFGNIYSWHKGALLFVSFFSCLFFSSFPLIATEKGFRINAC